MAGDQLLKIMGALSTDKSHIPIKIHDYEKILSTNARRELRDVFMRQHDMVRYFVPEGVDEYPDDPESVGFVDYKMDALFVDGHPQPFIADRLFANRFMDLMNSFKYGADKKKVYVFEGPQGSGKSMFIDNFIRKAQEYTLLPEGLVHGTTWVIPTKEMTNHDFSYGENRKFKMPEQIVVDCPSHDSPLLMIPKNFRRAYLESLIKDDNDCDTVLNSNAYKWIFEEEPCTICISLYNALLDKFGDHARVWETIHAKPYVFDRRFGIGTTVFNPSDPTPKKDVENPILQAQLNEYFSSSNAVSYLFSYLARTKNGIFVLNDLTDENAKRLQDMHTIISDDNYKVNQSRLEEQNKSMIVVVTNPEDIIKFMQDNSFRDRMEIVPINYVLDYKSEVRIYMNGLGQEVGESFVPGVIEDFGKIVVATRLNPESSAIRDWISDPSKYKHYADSNLMLAKLLVYTGTIPEWLSEMDRKRFTKDVRKALLHESEAEGQKGFSGRDSFSLFKELYMRYGNFGDRQITHTDMLEYLVNHNGRVSQANIKPFIKFIEKSYEFNLLQHVKEAAFLSNSKNLEDSILNYICSTNYEPGQEALCSWTGDEISVSEKFMGHFEKKKLGLETVPHANDLRMSFRKDVQSEYSKMLAQNGIYTRELMMKSSLYKRIEKMSTANLRDKVLDPFIDNANFREAIRLYGKPQFHTFDERVRHVTTAIINGMEKLFNYRQQSAQNAVIYIIDNKIAKKFPPNGHIH